MWSYISYIVVILRRDTNVSDSTIQVHKYNRKYRNRFSSTGSKKSYKCWCDIIISKRFEEVFLVQFLKPCRIQTVFYQSGYLIPNQRNEVWMMRFNYIGTRKRNHQVRLSPVLYIYKYKLWSKLVTSYEATILIATIAKFPDELYILLIAPY